MQTPASHRRRMLAQSAAVAALLAAAGLWPGQARAAWNRAAFEARSLADVVKALGGAAPVASKDVLLGGPDIAENGSVVPLVLSSGLAGIRRLVLLVEKNPNILSAVFELGEGVEADFRLNLKMAQSSNVYLVAMMDDGRVLYAVRDIKVTIGSCGV